jgi:D-threo-aldose 1-dehydrogenase
MQQVTLPGSSLRTSRFIMGTASLFNAGPRKKRLALLQAAIDHGFTHFDTAPYYGFGWAERDLGLVLKQHPNVTVTTKVGIYSAGGEEQSQLSVLLRKSGKRVLPGLAAPAVNFSLARAKLSLAASLKRLQRDHVAAYMLHEPELALVQTDEWQRWLEHAVRQGQVGVFGLALTPDRLQPFLAHAPGLAPLVQLPDSLDAREADLLAAHGRPLQITYGYVSAARAAGSSAPVPDVLRAALQRNAAGAVIVSTTRPERMQQYAQIAAAAQ